MSDETKGLLFGLIAVVAFGLTLPATRFVVPYMDPVFIGLGRAVLAAVVAAFLLVLTRQKIPTANQIKKLLVVVAGVVFGFPVLSAWAMQHVPASHGGVVLGILPLATAVGGALVAGERPSAGFWIVGLTGSALVIVFALMEGAGTFELADIALLGAILAAAAGYSVGGQLSKELGGWQVICWALVLSLPLIIIPAWIQAPALESPIPLIVWANFLYLALVSQLLGFFAWNKGLALGGIARVGQTQLLQPFVTLAASALLLGESLGWRTLVFAALVVLVVAVGKQMPVSRRV